MSRNKWIFGIVGVAAIVLVVTLSVALPGRNIESDNHQTTTSGTEQTSDKPPETIPAQTTPQTTTKPVEESTKPEATETKQTEISSTKESETTKVIESETTIVKETVEPSSEYPIPKDINAKAVYLNAGAAGTPSVIDHIIDLASTTELNAVVIDIKDGPIFYKSEVGYAKEFGLSYHHYDPEAIISQLHENNVYVIGRLVCFRDPDLAVKMPELAIQTQSGALWKENGNTAWLNPYHPDARQYLLDLAVEAAEKGFDEIQLDYIRFPTGTGGKDYYGENLPSKIEAIESFLDMAVEALKPYGVKVTADIFGIVGLSESDGNYIGQHLETVGKNIDYICPMVYPSHYANETGRVMGNGTGTFLNGVLYKAPDLNPYEIVYGTLLRMRQRLDNTENYKADLRPYLQAFTASYLPGGYYQHYGPEQIRQQIQAVYDAGYEEWILWDHNSNYPKEAFLSKQNTDTTEKAASESQAE
ncbi:MAG TPA: GTP-binding protein [Clostridiales bacterium]|nr:GTP-binding protein [Clostridiales bacterium]